MSPFSFTNYIPYITNSYNNKTPVKITIPMNGAILTINVNNQPSLNAAINYVRSQVLLYFSNLRRIGITSSSITYPFTSAQARNNIVNYLNNETLEIYRINNNINQ